MKFIIINLFFVDSAFARILTSKVFYPELSLIFMNRDETFFTRCCCHAPISFNKSVELQLYAVNFNFIMFN